MTAWSLAALFALLFVVTFLSRCRWRARAHDMRLLAGRYRNELTSPPTEAEMDWAERHEWRER